MIYAFNDISPNVDSSVYIAPGSHVIGNVTIKKDASVWFNVTIRGDNDKVTIGEGSNIQEGSVVHVDPSYPVIIEDDVTVGHRCIIHGCTIEEGAMIGMGAIILNGAHIKKGAVVAAGAVVGENKVVDEYTLVAGVPAKPIKKVNEDLSNRVLEGTQHYVKNAKLFSDENNLKVIE